MFDDFEQRSKIPHQEDQKTILTVSQFSQYLKKELEHSFEQVWIVGELSGVFKAQSGHIYCQIKDEQSQFKLVIFKGVANKLLFQIQEGQQVIVCAQITVYKPRGELQLTAKSLEPEGLGALKLAYDQLKQRLKQEGLFEIERKKPLPEKSQTIGLITSKDGAVLHDMIKVIRRRDPTVKIIHYVTSVQGAQALEQLIRALNQAADDCLCDVYIVARGGGSLEDLWNFNEERLVRTIAQFPYPIISAIGHETDVTLSDFVADKRAPTPSIAAELVTSDRALCQEYLEKHPMVLKNLLRQVFSEKEQSLDVLTLRLQKAFEAILREVQMVFQRFYHQARLIKHRINSFEQQIDILKKTFKAEKFKKLYFEKNSLLKDIQDRFNDQINVILQAQKIKLESKLALLKIKAPKHQVSLLEQNLKHLQLVLTQKQRNLLQTYEFFLERCLEKLKSSSVHQQLKKGFALVMDENLQRLHSVQEIKISQNYQLTLHDGAIKVKAIEIL